ncbi:MAG TPA: alpha-E domain-containing protein [Polyangiaceae bacterium]|nr:alpha-E domain-containing protein [Polyangiaceae bacterium]
MLSRVAEAIYWMGRYAERAENVARFVDVSFQVMLDLPEPLGDPWAGVVGATGDEALYAARHGTATRDGVVRFLTFDAGSPNSILSCLRKARENARSVREVISSEMWEQINKWYLLVRDASTDQAVLDDPHDFLTEVKQASHLFVGIAALTMSHGEGWHFGRIGRLLERADQTSRIVDAKQALLLARPSELGASLDEINLSALLRSVSALEMYRKRHGRIAFQTVIGFLLLEKMFPRSVRYCLNEARRSLHAITGQPPEAGDTIVPERLLGRLGAEYEYASVDEVLAEGLHEHLDRLQSKLNEVGLAISQTFFAVRPHVQEPPAARTAAPAPETAAAVAAQTTAAGPVAAASPPAPAPQPTGAAQ